MSNDDGYVQIVEDVVGPADDWDDARGKYTKVGDIEVEDLPPELETYLSNHVKNRFAERTWYNRVTVAKHWMVYCVAREEKGSERNIDYLNPSVVDIEDFVTDQLSAGYKHSSIENTVYALSAMFKYLSKRGYTDANPIDHEEFDMGLETNSAFQDIRYIEEDDFEKIFDEVDKLRDKILISLLWDTGVRATELVSIYISDIEDDEQKIKLKTAKQEGEREKDRSVYYTRRTENLLREWIDKGGRKQYLDHEDSPYLLIGKASPKLNSRRPTEVIREYAEAAGVQAQSPTANAAGQKRRKVTAHCFRHSFSVLRVKEGMPIVYLSDLLGHADIQQTRLYLKFRDDDLKDAYNKYRP